MNRCPKCGAKVRIYAKGRNDTFCSKTCRLAHKTNISREEQLKIETNKRAWTIEEMFLRQGRPVFRVLEHARRHEQANHS